jgi:hypothetical protein
MKPYINIEETNDYIIREFDENIDPIELMWHRDRENRLVEAVEPTDWLYQEENKLPISMDKPIFIPAGVWHRTIKGNGNLRIKINKF